jgi:hypothetical protein
VQIEHCICVRCPQLESLAIHESIDVGFAQELIFVPNAVNTDCADNEWCAAIVEDAYNVLWLCIKRTKANSTAFCREETAAITSDPN